MLQARIMIKSKINRLSSQQECFGLMLPAVTLPVHTNCWTSSLSQTKTSSFWLVNVLIKGQDNIYSQEYPFSIHPFHLNEPSSKSETGCISKVDHGLGEGEGNTVHMGLFLGVPVQRADERLQIAPQIN